MSNDRIKASKNEHPERIPASVGILPAAWMKHREALEEITERHPLLVMIGLPLPNAIVLVASCSFF